MSPISPLRCSDTVCFFGGTAPGPTFPDGYPLNRSWRAAGHKKPSADNALLPISDLSGELSYELLL